MNKKLVMYLKKLMFSIVMGASALGTTIPSVNLYAATTAAATKAEQIGIVNIKDVTLTAHNVTAGEYEGSFKIGMTMEKTSGIPKNVDHMLIDASTDVELDGKKVNFILDKAEITKKISDTQAELSVYAFAMTKNKDGSISDEKITLDQLKGKSIDFKLDNITYFANYTELTPEFKNQFKKVPKLEGVTAAQTNIGLDQEDINFINGKLLPHGGLNIPAINDTTVFLDNIGFVDGKLVVRLEHTKGCFSDFSLVDEAGKPAPPAGYFGTEIGGVFRYEIGDLETLAKYTPKLKVVKEIAKDEEKGSDTKNVTKTFTCNF